MALQRLNLARKHAQQITQPLRIAVIAWLVITLVTVITCLLLRSRNQPEPPAKPHSNLTHISRKPCNVEQLNRQITKIKRHISQWNLRIKQHNQVAAALHILSNKLPTNSRLLSISITSCAWKFQLASNTLSTGVQMKQALNTALTVHFQLTNVHELSNNQYQFNIDSETLCKDS